jgi:hypothetical protein
MVRTHHQEIEDQIGRCAQDVESLAARETESIVHAGVCTAHSLDHLLTQLHWWRERLRIPAKNVAKIDVEESAV